MANWESTKELLASAVQNASGAGSSVDLSGRDRLLRQVVSLTGVTGTVSLTVRLEASADGAGGWRTFATFDALTTAGTANRQTAISPERYVRVAWQLTGGGTAAFAVTGTLGIAYANLEQFAAFGMPGSALEKTPSAARAEAIAAATEVASGMIARRYGMPLDNWGVDMAQATCKLAAYDMIAVRGLAPDKGDVTFRTRYDDAIKWLTDVADGKIIPVNMESLKDDEDSDGVDDNEESVEMITYAPRAWR